MSSWLPGGISSAYSERSEPGMVTWLWTINTIHRRARVGSPGPWWPGSSYVTWVGIDGYYYNSNSTFASLFGPTIAAVRALTNDPILIAETAAAPAAGQAAKIADLFAGIHLYGLLGFVWFDAVHIENWRLEQPDGNRGVPAWRPNVSYVGFTIICMIWSGLWG